MSISSSEQPVNEGHLSSMNPQTEITVSDSSLERDKDRSRALKKDEQRLDIKVESALASNNDSKESGEDSNGLEYGTENSKTNLNAIKPSKSTDDLEDTIELSSDKVKLAASIVRLTPVMKSQLDDSQTLPVLVRGHIVELTQAKSDTICNTSSPTASKIMPALGILSSPRKISRTNSSSFNHSIPKQSTTDSVTKTELASTTVPKSTTSSCIKKPPLSRSDLAASTISSLHIGPPIGTKTRPLLMNHNHRQNQSQATSLGLTEINDKVMNISSNATKTIATNLSSQLILSSLMTTNAGQKVQQLSSASSLNGLQFCIATPPSAPLVGSKEMSTSNSNCSPLIASNTTQSSTTATKNRSSPEMLSPNSTTAAGMSTKSKTSVGVQMNRVDGNAEKSSSEITSPSTAASQGPMGTANAAAARLIDLGKRLLEATREGKVDQVRHLVVDSGAPFTSDWLGTTALHIAAQNGSLDIAEILIRGGVNRDARTKLERTALHLAAQSGSLEVVDLLLTNGADVNGRDMLKMTPLHWAVERGHVCVVERLLIAGADFKIKSKFKLTPIDMARNAGYVDILELFKNWTDGSKDEINLDAYIDIETSLNESQEFLDIDYHLALVDSATNSRGDSMLDNEEPCMDLVSLEWNKFEDFEPDLFLPNDSEDEQKVEYLMKIVEELQKENQQLRQRVEQLSSDQ